MSIDVTGLFDKLESHALSLGYFERVNGHEPKNAPGAGVSAAVWIQDLRPAPAASGLSSTSARLVFSVRVYQNMLTEPQDSIDPAVVAAVDGLIRAYSGDFTLDGTVMVVDLLGAHGVPLSATAGYINQDGQMMRVVTVTVPCIISDAWTQTA